VPIGCLRIGENPQIANLAGHVLHVGRSISLFDADEHEKAGADMCDTAGLMIRSV
jgi:hypothetical protein